MNCTYTQFFIDFIKPKWIGTCKICGKSWLIRNRKQIYLCTCGRFLIFKRWRKAIKGKKTLGII